MTEATELDVIVVGAGLAGVSLCYGLTQRGISCAVIDQRRVQPPIFKAEKLEPDQSQVLSDLGLTRAAEQVSSPIHRVALAHRGRLLNLLEIEQRGYHYQDLVNALRDGLQEDVRFVTGRAAEIKLSGDSQEVVFGDGQSLRGRLVVLATGAAGKLHQPLGMHRRSISSRHSLCVGFSLTRSKLLEQFAESLTCFADNLKTNIDYLTLFPVPDGLRANMFTYWLPTDSRVAELKSRGLEALHEWMPGLRRLVGDVELTSGVQARPIDLYRMEGVDTAGIVLIGDAYQSVCPATGTGLSKVLVDVETLLKYVPEWLAEGDLSAGAIAEYYSDEKKRATDTRSLSSASYRRRVGTDASLKFRLHRKMELFRLWLTGRKAVWSLRH